MNERNVDALRRALLNCGIESRWADELSMELASRGVLVPSALTDEECIDVIEDAASPHEVREKKVPWVREGLERIAKGEQ